MTLDRLTAVVRELVEALNSGQTAIDREHAQRAKALLDGLEAPKKCRCITADCSHADLQICAACGCDTPFVAPSDYEPSPAVYASGEVPMVGDVIRNTDANWNPLDLLAIVGEHPERLNASRYNLVQRGPKSQAEGDREPSEAQVEAALHAWFVLAGIQDHDYSKDERKVMRAALKAAHAVSEKERK